MRAAIPVAIAVATVMFACGEETGVVTSTDDAGTAPEKKSDGGAEPNPGTGSSSGKRAPDGCLLETTGFRIGTKAENLARTDAPNAVGWTDVDRALETDEGFASVTLAAGQESAKLRVSGFGFAIPSKAATWGIEVELKRRAPDGGIEDQQINVEIEGKPSRYKFVEGPWPTTIVGTHAYGQAVDTWGVDLFPADVNKPSFGVTLVVKRGAGGSGSVTAKVDSLKVAIHYCPVKS